ncbi:ATP-binding protein [Rhizobium leguminosarum]|uniref:ATP-binding protein n=1 Tax=Rhizobium leguminosarum TaxID=384 RepID=UPI001A91480B|nr:ATP-binding protein [Rhizobium leguminosarum]MBY5553761.1 ATP-binding protein [Rhizobium leguminosarum]QSW24828.1 ATP-binding protein [Rhizobium leguminosarum]
MAISLKSLKSSRSTTPPITLIYGVDGIGKTSLATEWPTPLYMPTEGQKTPSDVDIPSTDIITSWEDIESVFQELLTTEHDFKTVIIDSLGGIAPFVEAITAARIGAATVDDNSKGSPAAYGNGYKESEVEWSVFMSGCEALSQAGINVILIGHPEIKRFDDPLEDPYDRYILKLNKRAAPLIREKCDIVAFLNYRISLKEKEVGVKKTVTHAVGGKERQIHLTRGAGFDAKNRFSMPDHVVYKKGNGYSELSKFWIGNIAAPKAA